MNRPLAAAAAALAILACGALPALAEPKPIPTDQLIPTMERQLADLRTKIERELKNDPAARTRALGYIDRTEQDFRGRVESLGRQPNYAVEAEYLGGAFEALILKKARQAVGIMTDRSVNGTQRIQMLKALDAGDLGRRVTFDQEFFARHKQEVEEVVAARLAWKQQEQAAGRMSGVPERHYRDNILSDFKNYSPLINAGQASVNVGVNGGGVPGSGTPGNPGPVVPPPVVVNPGNGAPNTGPVGNPDAGGQPPADNPPSGNGAADWTDIMKQVTWVGAPRAIAGSAAEALDGGRYAEAADLARAALEFDPANKNALAVLYSAKGRAEGAEAGASGLAVAKAGAAAFAPSRFAGDGPVGAAGPGAEPSSLTSAGAARAASAQAGNGARSALKLGDADGALDILNKALNQDPNDPALLNLRAQTYGRLGRWEEALKDAVAGLALAPGNMALLNTKALSENRTKRYREALETAEQMIGADPRNAWGYANRAHAHGGLGDKNAMLADINQAARLDPTFARAAADAAALQLPTDADMVFLFPGELGKGGAKTPAAAAPGRGASFSIVVGAGIAGGLLLALGLLTTVLAPLRDTVVSVFTRSERTAPRAHQAVATAQPASVAGNAGGLIRGQYEISRQIGAGGMGMVYEGTDRSLGRRVAIKKMRDELRLNARERDRFVIEAKTVASLHHPNIVDIYAIAEEGEDVYLVFEYVDGKTVHDLVQTAGRLSPAESVSVTRAMGEALTYAHSRGVIHRDMKPSNVMRTADGRVKVMDFGIARMAKDALTRYSMTNTVVGTPPYMAPEQEQGVVRKESDVYSLAICAYEMLTGKLPFIGIGAGMLMNKINMSYIPPSRNIAGLPEALDEVFLKAFQADPDRRYRTPQEFVAALSAAADGARAKAA